MAAKEQVQGSKRVKMGTAAIVFNVIGCVLVGLVALVCLLPFIMLISGSFSSEQAIRFTGYGLLPKDFTLEAYRIVFKYPQKIARAYGVSITITLIGTVLGLFITTMAAYVISRKDFKYRNAISFFSTSPHCLTAEW